MKEPLKKFSDFQFESIYKCVSSVPAKKHAGYVIIDDKLHQPEYQKFKDLIVGYYFICMSRFNYSNIFLAGLLKM